jgi:NarL family two-component system response regulator LiaR
LSRKEDDVKDRISVLVVDDHTVVRGGLRLFLLAFPDLELVGEAVNGEDAVRFCSANHPQVVLMDLMMPVMNGVEATRAIRRISPQTQVIALTSFPDNQLVQDALDAGAISYMLKNAQAAELAAAIRAAHAGKPTLAPEAASALIRHAGNSALHQALTEREWDVYRLMLSGKKNAEIASLLVVSLSTAKYHVSKVLSKLKVNSRAEAIAYGVQHHLVGPDIPE